MKKEYSLKYMLTLTLAVSALTCVVIALTIGRQLGMFTGRFNNVRDYAALLKYIDELYIGDYSSADIHDESMRAAVYSLGDRWSYYLSEEEYSEYLDYSNNSYVGIGIGVETDEGTGGLRVLYVYKDSAAETAGLTAGDIICAIDGQSAADVGFEGAMELLSRGLGETAKLTVLREDGREETLEVIYSIVFTDPVEYEMLDNNIGYVSLLNFVGGSADSFIAACGELLEAGAGSFIFDVRSNGGGRVNELTKILDYLLPEGEIFIAVTKDKEEDITMSEASSVNLPCAVLVDKHSYSAAEYFAAMLREYDYAVIVGEHTTGKNRSQVTIELPGGGAIHISSGEYLTKNRVSLFETEGLKPDIEVVLTEEEYTKLLSGSLPRDSDPQLLAAINILNGE